MPELTPRGKKETVQHRGKPSAETPPNSFKSILQYEVERGESLIDQAKIALETDVFLLADGNVVLLHPVDAGIAFDKLDEIEALTLEQLTEKLKATAAKRGQPEMAVPTIEDYIRQGMDRGLEFYLDIKGQNVESSVRTARAVVQKVHALREQGLFEWRPGMVEGSEEYVRTYPERNMKLHCLSLDAVRAAQDEMTRLGELMTTNLGWVPDPKMAPRYVDLVDAAIEGVRQRMGDETTVDQVLNMAALDWLRYGIDIAAELGCESVLVDKTPILSTAQADQVKAREIIDYAHDKGVKLVLSVIKTDAEAQQLLGLGIDKVMFEPA